MKTHYQILIIGGGNAGISVTARLLRTDPGYRSPS
jgi:cation diffusion facilitator CzcD-associated flavoprotein CzcO